ncbi:hypothetical protein KXV80_001908, partial [Aspergillus fumigatus]
MSLVTVSAYCILCGNDVPIVTSIKKANWTSLFRIVSQSGDGAHLSGLGYREGSMAWSVPRAENSCWNDEPKPQCRRVNFMGSVVHVPSQEAFLLHEACWSLLRRVYGQKTVPLARLLNGFKLVSLALGRPLRPKRKSRRSLLDTALWYPSIPPENLRIADGFSVGQSPTTSRHSLLFWVWLGGPGGSYLQYLTGISGTRFKGGLGGIEFHFSTDSVPITSGSWVFVMTRKGRISPLM